MLLPETDIRILLLGAQRGKGSEPEMTGSVPHRYLGCAAHIPPWEPVREQM
jgi:hypothetical protein